MGALTFRDVKFSRMITAIHYCHPGLEPGPARQWGWREDNVFLSRCGSTHIQMVPDQVGDDNVEVGGSVFLLLTTLSFRYLISFNSRFSY